MDLRASRRFFNELRKNSPSVRTERAEAPADSSDCARATGSKGSRRTPREGEAGLSSASTFRVSDRKSTRLNSSHSQISYAVFCLKKKKQYTTAYVMTHYTCRSVRHTPL